MKQVFRLVHETARQMALDAIKKAQGGQIVTLSERLPAVSNKTAFCGPCCGM